MSHWKKLEFYLTNMCLDFGQSALNLLQSRENQIELCPSVNVGEQKEMH
jgi:hypothetical protein